MFEEFSELRSAKDDVRTDRFRAIYVSAVDGRSWPHPARSPRARFDPFQSLTLAERRRSVACEVPRRLPPRR